MPLRLQTCMKEQPKFKQVRGISSADASRRARAVIPTKRPAPRQQRAEPNKPLARSDPRFHPARGLMICFGWLRLFQTIVSDGIPSTRRTFSHET